MGELSQDLQVKLLRVLQERTFERVGGTEPVLTDIRVISATNKKLKEEVDKGNFRQDLFYRLNVMPIVLPVLKNRQEDIPLLVNYFIKKFENELKSEVPIKGIDKEAERILLAYSWPGNVRELENVIERAMIMCPSELIRSYDLPKDFRNNIYDKLDLQGIPNDAKLYDTLAAIEKKMLKRALKLTNNVQSNAAKMLGIGKSGFNKKLNKYKLH